MILISILIILICEGLLPAAVLEQHPQHGNLESHMEHMETIVDYIGAWEESVNQADSILRLRSGRTLMIARHNPRYAVWQRTIRFQQKQQEPVYAEFDTETNTIKVLYPSTPQRVDSVEQASDDRTTIYLYRAPSPYFVRKDRLGSQNMVALLEAAAKTHQMLLVCVHPSTLEILDVRTP